MKRLPIADGKYVARKAGRMILEYKGELGKVLVTQVLTSITSLATPFLLGMLVDHVSGGTTRDYINRMGWIIVAMIVAQSIFTYLANRYSQRLGEFVFVRLRNDVVARVMGLPLSVVESAGTGDLLARTNNDVERLAFTVRFGLARLVILLTNTLFFILAGIFISPLVGWTLLLSVPPIALVLKWYLPRAIPAYRAEMAIYSRMDGLLTESLEHAPTVEALSLQDARVFRTERTIAEVVGTERYAAYLRTVLLAVLGGSSVIPPLAALIVGGLLAQHGWITLGAITTVTLYAWQIRNPINELSFWLDELQVTAAAVSRIFGVDLVKSDRTISPETPADAQIKARDVTYSYIPGRPVLHDIDLDLIPGERLAMVGPSGAGKSTLGRMLAGIHPPESGSVKVGGVDVTALPEKELHKNVVLVTQEHHVFVGTIAQNLRLAQADATDQQLRHALDIVEATAWVDKLPEGMETMVGSGNHELTDAQAQQIALARLILMDPHTLILDEATSLLDPTAARSLERSLSKVLEGRTVVAIAHRLYTAHDADRIAVVLDGRIVELGSHEELVAAGGEYASLWKSWQHI